MVLPLFEKDAWTPARIEICITSLFIACLLIWTIYLYTHMGAYCFFRPDIDTIFACGYSDEKFDRLGEGASAAEVRRLLGEPLAESHDLDGATVWWYTAHGKCTWGNFAWLGRAVRIRAGVVVDKIKRVQYD
jgi:hypothetical protein